MHIALMASLALLAGQVHAATLAGHVVGITDGDTITVLDASKTQYAVRLHAMDAPERNQPFGARSKQNLSGLVFGKDVTVEWRKKNHERLVGKVLVDETGADCAFRSCLKSLDAGLQQIRDGLAWHAKQFEREQSPEDRARYAAAEIKARDARAGLWTDAEPVPPWEWRRGRRR